MTTRLHLVGPLGLLFAALAPWTCNTYTLPDGGVSLNNPHVGIIGSGGNPDGGGGAFAFDAGAPVVLGDGGQPGIVYAPDGGITIGPASDFVSDFVYMSNASEGTVSRIVIPGDGGAPFEQARYYAIVPIDNHGQNEAPAWQTALACFYGTVDAGCSGSGQKAPIQLTYPADGGFTDAGYRQTCSSLTNDGGCMDGGQKTYWTALTSDGGSVDAGQKPQICGTYTGDAGCTFTWKAPTCFTSTSGTVCSDAGPNPPVCGTYTGDGGCVDAGPKPIVWVVIHSDGGPNDGGPAPLACVTYTSDAGCNDAGFALTYHPTTGDAGYIDAGPNPIVCSTGIADTCSAIDQLNVPDGGINSPSRTVIDRNGNVFVVLRAPSFPGSVGLPDGGAAPNLQSGVTEIINVGDHPEQCTIRCPNRTGWALPDGGPFPFSAGLVMPLSDGGTFALPASPPLTPWNAQATTYSCPGHTPTDETDPVNYDDCVKFSIPLGDPHPDIHADPSLLTAGTSFGRAGVVSPNCDPGSRNCDIWLGMWTGASWIHLGWNTGSGVPFDVSSVHPVGVSPYGATVDCAGILWSVGQSANGAYGLAAVTTVGLNDVAYNYSTTSDTVLTNFGSNPAGVPNSSDCTKYGIASDPQQRIWLAAGTGGAKACSFTGGTLLTALGNNPAPVSYSTFKSSAQAGWSTYDFTSVKAPPANVDFSAGRGALARGINIDKDGMVYLGIDTHPWNGINPFTQVIENGMAALSFNPNSASGPSVNCLTPGVGGTSCGKAQINWAYNNGNVGTYGGGTIGVDLDAEGEPWFGNFGGNGGTAQGLAVRIDNSTGLPSATVPVGNGVYSYSDFTGYALRHITLNQPVYQQTIAGCGVSPELTSWQSLAYQASSPPGTDMSIDVRVVDALDNASINAAADCAVCSSIHTCGNPLDLTSCNLPQGAYLVVLVTLTPKVCDVTGTAPVLYSLSAARTCAGD